MLQSLRWNKVKHAITNISHHPGLCPPPIKVCIRHNKKSCMSDIPYFLQSWNASVTLAALLPLCGAAAAQKQRAGSKCVFGFCATMQAVSESVERRTVKWEKEDAPCLKVGGQSSADLSLCDILQRAARYMHPDASSSFCALPLLQTRHSCTNLNKLEMFGDGLKSSGYPVFTAEMLFATFSCCEV